VTAGRTVAFAAWTLHHHQPQVEARTGLISVTTLLLAANSTAPAVGRTIV
jgi:hypothetical protein